MHHPYARVFTNQDQAEAFLHNVLKFNDKPFPGILSKIVNAEQGLVNLDVSEQTLHSTHYRERNFASEESRWELRRKILEDLKNLSRLPQDEDIKLGVGGALPNNGVMAGNKAFVIIGLPASGKSTISSEIAEQYHAVILDPDYAKRKLPEWDSYPCSATIVHEESDKIISGFGEINPYGLISLYEHCLTNNYNIVIPTIGHTIERIKDLANILNTANYETHLILVSLKREDATKRAIVRLHRTKRYVPLGLIFDNYINNPLMTYYLLRSKFPDLFTTFSALSTHYDPPICIDKLNVGPCELYQYDPNILF